MVGVRAYGLYRHPARTIRKLLRPGPAAEASAAWSSSSPRSRALPTHAERAAGGLAKVPLLVSADMERGHLLPRCGAAWCPCPTRWRSARRARRRRRGSRARSRRAKARALGIHWAFAPVADVNNNPRTRHQHPLLRRGPGARRPPVGRVRARRARAAACWRRSSTSRATATPRPTATCTWPPIGGDRERLDRGRAAPFRRAIEAGVDSVMLGHIAVPAARSHRAPRPRCRSRSRPTCCGATSGSKAWWSRTPGDAGRARGLDGRGGGARGAARARTSSCCRREPTVAVQAIARAVREGRSPKLAHRRVGAAHPGGEGAARPRIGTARSTPRPSAGRWAGREDVARAVEWRGGHTV